MSTNDIMERSSSEQQTNPEKSEQGSSSMKDKARALQKTAQEWQRQAGKATRKAAKYTDIYVRENPWNVIAGVAISCLIVGILIGRRRG